MKKYFLSGFTVVIWVFCCFGQATLLDETFPGSLDGWATIDHNDSAGTWVFSTNPFNTADNLYYGPQTFFSPTASNGFALMLSNLNTNRLNSDLISPAINCSGQNYIGLEFNEWLYIAGSATATVSISTDSISWTQVYDAAANSTGANSQPVQLDISLLAANRAKVWIKFNYQAIFDAWWVLDDIRVLALPAIDVAAVGVDAQNYVGIGNYNIPFTVENMGGTALTSLTASFSVNNTAPVSQIFTGLNLNLFGTASLKFSVPASLSSVGPYNLKVIASLPNGTPDANPLNDTAAKTLIAISQVPVKNVLLEEFTTAFCGNCPAGTTYMEAISNSADSAWAIPIAVHAGFGTDAMTTTEANTLANAFSPGTSPQATIDRVVYPQQSDVAIGIPGLGYNVNDNNINFWKAAAEAREGITTPASVTAYDTYDEATRVLTVTVQSTFYGPVTGDLRMNCYIIEDSVVGSGRGYDQHSYYYNGPTNDNPWYRVGTWSSSAQYATIAGFVHQHVERDLLNGPWGTSGTIPGTTTDGGTYTETYTCTLPAAWRSKFISLVPFVYEYNGNFMSGRNEVLNAIRLPLNSTAKAEVGKIRLYPNPARDLVYLNFTLDNDAGLSFEVYNITGQRVSNISQVNFAKGNFSAPINTSELPNGVYFVTVRIGVKVLQTLKFVISR